MITPPGLSNSTSTVSSGRANNRFASARGHENNQGLQKNNIGPENANLANLRRRAALLLNVEHNFDGVVTTEAGDRLEFSSQLSFELSHSREFEIIARENQEAIERAYGLREPGNSGENGEDNDLSGVQQLDAMVPEFANSENTSQRIFDFARSMLPFFLASADRNGNNELTEENFEEFMDMMRNSIDEGFRQAGDIIRGLSLMNEDLGGLIELTYNKVQEKLDSFEEETLEQIQAGDRQTETEKQLGGPPVGGHINSSYEMNFNYETQTSVEYAA